MGVCLYAHISSVYVPLHTRTKLTDVQLITGAFYHARKGLVCEGSLQVSRCELQQQVLPYTFIISPVYTQEVHRLPISRPGALHTLRSPPVSALEGQCGPIRTLRSTSGIHPLG